MREIKRDVFVYFEIPKVLFAEGKSRLLGKGFTLVELMVAVAIFSIGIVLVLRSFVNSASTLEYLGNKISAVQFLEAKMQDYELIMKEAGGVSAGEYKEDLEWKRRKAVFSSEIYPLEMEEFMDYINEVDLSLSWWESNMEKSEKFSVYLRSQKEE